MTPAKHLTALTTCLLTAALTAALAASPARASEGLSIPPSVQNNCLICHRVGAPEEPTQAIAPPLFAVKNHLREFRDRDAFIAHVSQWVKAPDPAAARMPGAVKKFGLMPALPLGDELLVEIAGWIYDTPMEKPNWYAEHYRREHGDEPGE